MRGCNVHSLEWADISLHGLLDTKRFKAIQAFQALLSYMMLDGISNQIKVTV